MDILQHDANMGAQGGSNMIASMAACRGAAMRYLSKPSKTKRIKGKIKRMKARGVYGTYGGINMAKGDVSDAELASRFNAPDGSTAKAGTVSDAVIKAAAAATEQDSHGVGIENVSLVMNESKLSPEEKARLWHWRLGHCDPYKLINMSTGSRETRRLGGFEAGSQQGPQWPK